MATRPMWLYMREDFKQANQKGCSGTINSVTHGVGGCLFFVKINSSLQDIIFKKRLHTTLVLFSIRVIFLETLIFLVLGHIEELIN